MSPRFDYVTDGASFINPFGIGFTVLAGMLLLVLPRRHALLPVIALACYMTMGVRVVVGGLDITMMRLLLLFAIARLICRGEWRITNFNRIDMATFALAIVATITYTLLWGDFSAFKYKVGQAVNGVGFYWFFRSVIRDRDDVLATLRWCAILMVPLALVMLLERSSGRNVFAAFGGVPEYTVIRSGRMRCQGPFAHPILAGTFGATLVPYCIALWSGRTRLLAVLGIAAACTIVMLSASSGPLFALVVALLGVALWPTRRLLKPMFWSLVFALVCLDLVMKAPIWFLLARVDVVSGSTGYHRAILIDKAVANLSGWWLIGTKSTESWSDDDDDHLFDVTNQYLVVGADGGLASMFIFILRMAYCFRRVGKSVRLKPTALFASIQGTHWCLGASLLAHTLNFLSVSYFDQNSIMFTLLLAMIASLPTVGSRARLSKACTFQRDTPWRPDAEVSYLRYR